MKAKVKSVWLYRAEGPINMNDREHTVETLEEAEDILSTWSLTVHKKASDKVDFKVTWNNDEAYEGTHYLKHERGETLSDQMISTLECYGGLKKPSHLSDKNWKLFTATLVTE